MNTLRTIIYGLIGIRFVALIETAPRSVPLVQLTNVSCLTLDEAYVDFKKCLLEKNKDDRLSLNLNANLLQPFVDVQVNAKLFRKVNKKFTPFLYDDLINFCDLLQNGKHQIFWAMMYRTLAHFSNINHTCPFEHDIIVSDFVLEAKEFKMVPLPRGQYMIQLVIAASKSYKAKVQLYIQRG